MREEAPMNANEREIFIPWESTGLGELILIPSNSRGLKNCNRVKFEAVNHGEYATIGEEVI